MSDRPLICRACKEAMPDIDWNRPCPHWQEAPENVAAITAENAALRRLSQTLQADRIDLEDCREGLRSLGEFCGCDHVDSPDDRAQQVRHIKEAFAAAQREAEGLQSQCAEQMLSMVCLKRELEQIKEEREAARAWVRGELAVTDAGDPFPEHHGCIWCGAVISGGRSGAVDHVSKCEANPLLAERDRLQAEVERLRQVMAEVASMPGREWLQGQLILADALNPEPARPRWREGGAMSESEREEEYAFPLSGTGRGMTLRDYFAAAALNGLLASLKGSSFVPAKYAEMAYEYADAMLKAREDGGA